MTICSKYGATRLEVDDGIGFVPILTPDVLNLHDCFNKNPLPANLECPSGLEEMCKTIYSSFGLKQPNFAIVPEQPSGIAIPQPKDEKRSVVLGFSSGLDSTYQAIRLKENGYNVHLLFIRGMNSYEGGQAWKSAPEMANRLGMELISMNMKKNMSKSLTTNPYKQQWPENPMKNEVILSAMVDLCLSRGYSNISMGDDLGLSLSDSVPGVNTSDAKEITESFMEYFVDSRFPGRISLLTIPKNEGKDVRLDKLLEYGLENLYYSCVTQGRFNQSFKRRVESKFGVKLFKNNCGTCRKCCMHNLILHYVGKQILPENYLAYCWEKMQMSGKQADAKFFNQDLPIEVRIHNLFHY